MQKNDFQWLFVFLQGAVALEGVYLSIPLLCCIHLVCFSANEHPGAGRAGDLHHHHHQGHGGQRLQQHLSYSSLTCKLNNKDTLIVLEKTIATHISHVQ